MEKVGEAWVCVFAVLIVFEGLEWSVRLFLVIPNWQIVGILCWMLLGAHALKFSIRIERRRTCDERLLLG